MTRVLPMLMTPLSIAAAGAGLTAHAAAAQSDVTIEVGASQIGPPLGLEAQSARYGVAGLRASHYAPGGSGVYGSFLGGHAFGGESGGDFLTASLSGTLAKHLSGTIRGALEMRLLAFGVSTPYPYDAVAVEGGPSLTFGSGPVSLEIGAVAGVGRSTFEVRGPRGRSRAFSDDLRRLGGVTELTIGAGPLRVGATAGYHDTPGGSFTSGGGRVFLDGSWAAVELRGDVWRTPVGTETTGGLALVIPLSGWSVRGFFGRSAPDPLTLAEPSSASVGLLLGRSLYAREAGARTGSQPWQVVSTTSAGATVRVAIGAPPAARTVALLGDFTLWEEVPMQRRNGRWEADVIVPAGTHHYGFLVDDQWYVPDDTRDVVPDEWGRLSAILVIEGVE